MTTRTATTFLISLLFGLSAYSQTIECLPEHLEGEENSYGDNSTLFNDEIYFIDRFWDLIKYNDTDKSYQTVDDLAPSFVNLRNVQSNDEALFYIGGFFGEDAVYFSDGSPGPGRLVVEYEGFIEQRILFDLGLIVIESNSTDNLHNGFFIDNQGSAPIQIMEGVDNFQDWAISESRQIAIISREDEEDFEGGVFFFDTASGMTITDEMVIPDACGTIDEARGFEDYIFYRCGGSNYFFSHDSQSSTRVSVNSADVKYTGETEDFMFMAFTFGRLYAIEKATLSTDEIANDLAIFPEFAVHGESVFYVNNGDVTSHDGNSEMVFEASISGNDNLLRAETLDGKVHIVVESGTFGHELLVLDEDDMAAELITEIDIFLNSDIAFHFLNESIIFANNDEEKGQEFFRLFYGSAFVDNDGDGVTNETDCDDNDATIYPGADEICDQIDNNCDGQIDEGLALTKYYQDSDGDGYGDSLSVFETCQTDPMGFVLNSDDCDDGNAAVNPAAEDLPDNGIDEDCDGKDFMVGVHELAGEELIIYPNPARSFINIDYYTALDYTVNLYNGAGQRVLSESQVAFLDLSSVGPGIYVLEVLIPRTNQRVIEKLVVWK